MWSDSNAGGVGGGGGSNTSAMRLSVPSFSAYSASGGSAMRLSLSIPGGGGGQEDGRGRGDDNNDHHDGGGGGNDEDEGGREQSVRFVPGRSSVGSGTGTAGKTTPCLRCHFMILNMSSFY